MKIGVISDTHNFFEPQIPARFKGVQHIIHAGDVGLPRILFQLEQIAPVTAVLGNTDEPGLHYPLTEVVELAGRKFLVHHIVNPHSLTEDFQARLQGERPAVVVFGHTHRPFRETIDGTLFFNPGYAGKSRFGLERSVAILHCGPVEIRSEYLAL
jgi:putative phosphoesterase